MPRQNRLTNPFQPCTVTLAVLLVSCGGGNGIEPSDNTGAGDTTPGAPGPTFSAIQSNVFTPSCAVSGCHVGAGAPQGLRLDEASSYGLLVGVASAEVASLLRVSPGNADDSYLIQKLEGTAAAGAQMPLGSAPLAQDLIDVIRQWIVEGALDDREPSSAPLRVSSLSPLPGAILGASPTEIIVMFDREVDASTLNEVTFLLYSSGGDGTFDDGNEERVTASAITTPLSGATKATLALADVGLPNDTYQVSILGAGASVILDFDANALDGEFSGSFPSGDGDAGGDFVASFTVRRLSDAATFEDTREQVANGEER